MGLLGFIKRLLGSATSDHAVDQNRPTSEKLGGAATRLDASAAGAIYPPKVDWDDAADDPAQVDPDDPTLRIFRRSVDGDLLIYERPGHRSAEFFSCVRRTNVSYPSPEVWRSLIAVRDSKVRGYAIHVRSQNTLASAAVPEHLPAAIVAAPSTASGVQLRADGAADAEADGCALVRRAIDRSNAPVFVTGKAGTGKSTILRQIATADGAIVLAPTGIAALNAGGQTIHSFCKFPLHPLTSKDVKRLQDTRAIRAVKFLIIDEVSMVRADLLDAVDVFFRKNRSSDAPFGGVQVVLFGDPYQLPPVVTNEQQEWFEHRGYRSAHFFDARVFRDIELHVVALSKVYRQADPKFVELLDSVRNGSATDAQLAALNRTSLGGVPAAGPPAITLTARRATAAMVNSTHLNRLSAPLRRFEAVCSGTINPDSVPAERVLELKVGARVMFIRNDLNGEYVNGTLGTVTGFVEDAVLVQTDDGRGVGVVAHLWESIRYTYDPGSQEIRKDVVGSFSQLPLKLGWAVTIHKSQGLTLDAAVVDLSGGAFAPGQAYVALSRCRSLEGLRLQHPMRRADILVDGRVAEFMRSAAEAATAQAGVSLS